MQAIFYMSLYSEFHFHRLRYPLAEAQINSFLTVFPRGSMTFSLTVRLRRSDRQQVSKREASYLSFSFHLGKSYELCLLCFYPNRTIYSYYMIGHQAIWSRLYQTRWLTRHLGFSAQQVFWKNYRYHFIFELWNPTPFDGAFSAGSVFRQTTSLA